jgi:peptidoglycan biosynthesis protein MviN/MurJ (putative lipid II flippase)
MKSNLPLTKSQIKVRQGIAGLFTGLLVSLIMAVIAGLNFIVFCKFDACLGPAALVNQITSLLAVLFPCVLCIRGLLRKPPD